LGGGRSGWVDDDFVLCSFSSVFDFFDDLVMIFDDYLTTFACFISVLAAHTSSFIVLRRDTISFSVLDFFLLSVFLPRFFFFPVWSFL